jgi:hypothetical protein
MTKISDQELQSTLLQLCEEAMRLYAKSSAMGAPECFVQNYCASELAKREFVITIGTNGKEFRKWFKAVLELDLKQFKIDLIIYHAAGDGNPDNARPRGLIEFKKYPDDKSAEKDIERTGRFLSKLNIAEAFGYFIACPCSDRPGWSPDKGIKRLEGLGNRYRAGPIVTRSFKQCMGNGHSLYGVIVGLPIPAAKI